MRARSTASAAAHGGDKDTDLGVGAMGIDPSGALLLTGACSGIADLGAGSLPDPLGSERIFLAKIAP